MRFLLRLGAEGVPSDRLLASVRALAMSAGADARNPKWTSRGALEIDVFSPTRADFDLFVSALRPLAKPEFIRDLNVAPPHRSDEEIAAEAREYFNAERYWECHEVLEGAWRAKEGAEKTLLQGVILVCAAYVHHQKGEDEVALGVLRRASARLGYPDREYHGIDLELLRGNVAQVQSDGKFRSFRI